jgi:hypothetical protein
VERPKFKAGWVLGAQKANLFISLLPGVNLSRAVLEKKSKGWVEQSGEPKI